MENLLTTVKEEIEQGRHIVVVSDRIGSYDLLTDLAGGYGYRFRSLEFAPSTVVPSDSIDLLAGFRQSYRYLTEKGLNITFEEYLRHEASCLLAEDDSIVKEKLSIDILLGWMLYVIQSGNGTIADVYDRITGPLDPILQLPEGDPARSVIERFLAAPVPMQMSAKATVELQLMALKAKVYRKRVGSGTWFQEPVEICHIGIGNLGLVDQLSLCCIRILRAAILYRASQQETVPVSFIADKGIPASYLTGFPEGMDQSEIQDLYKDPSVIRHIIVK